VLSPDRDLTARGRLRVFAVWQLPTLLFAAYLAAGLALTAPHLLQRPLSVMAFAAVAAASVAAVAVPWERIGLAWRVLVPAIDLAGAVVLRLDLAEVRSIGLLSVLPIMWLAFDFGRRGVALAVLGGCAQSVVPLVSSATGPNDGLAWVQASLFPIMAVVLAVVARRLSMIIGRNHQALLDSNAAVRASLDLARQRLVVVEKVMSVVEAGVCYLDDTGEPLLTNARALELAQLAGRHPDHLPEEARFAGHHVYSDDHLTLVPAAEQIIPCARRGEEVDGRLHRYGPPGDQRAVVVSCHQLYDGPVRLGAVAAAWDVTDLIEAVEVRDRFLATVSHELRTPLTSIIGHHDLLADADAIVEDPLLARSLASARRNAHVLMSRIEELLEGSRTKAAQPTLDGVPVDLSDVLAEAVGRHRRPAANAGIVLRPDLTDVTDPAAAQVWAPADAGRLGRALDQLLGNALKYTDPGGAVTVTLHREDHRDGSGTAVLSVSDTGCGMTPAEVRRAFDRFYRADGARASAIQGIGLGLSIARSLVEAHGGAIELSSTPGQGTVAVIRLPLPAPQRT